jgi:gluconokinase
VIAVPDCEGAAATRPRPLRAVVMGVAGCGKTVIGEALSAALGWRFIEGDRLHPPENIARMAAGLPLADEHRWKWLDAIGGELGAARRERAGAIAACSALKRIYRDRLRGYDDRLFFIHLAVDKATALERVGSRKGHFMPATLVDSQFADLQPPGSDEAAIALDATRPAEVVVAEALAALRLR